MSNGASGQSEDGNVGDNELDTLFTELKALVERNDNYPRQEEICRRILSIDSQEHGLDAEVRGTVLGTRGIALREMARRVDGEEHQHVLQQAIACYDEALIVRRREIAPLQWAKTHNNKGNALNALAISLSGEERASVLHEAVVCYDSALLEYQLDSTPFDWAMTHNNKGNALSLLANSLSGEERARTLRDASSCYDSALLVYTREAAPLQWATALTNKGNALNALAISLSGEERASKLREAVVCYDSALLEYDGEVAPLQRAMALANKANALIQFAEGLSGNPRAQTLNMAIACCDEALIARRREVTPFDWAMTLNSKGSALKMLAQGLSGDSRVRTLELSIACYDMALEVRRREAGALNWAVTLNNKGNALRILAECQHGESRSQTLQRAVSAYSDALTVYQPEVQPGGYRHIAQRLIHAYLLVEKDADNPTAEQRALDQAREVASSAISAAELLELQAPSLTFRQQEWSENASLYNLAACVHARQGQLDEAVALIERGRARGLAEAAGRRNAELALLTDDDRAQYLFAVEQVQAIEARGRELRDPLELVEEARTVNERLFEIVARLRNAYPDFLPEREASISALSRRLRAGEALVYLIPQEPGTLLLVLARNEEAHTRWLPTLTSTDIFALAVQHDAATGHEMGFLPAALGWLHADKRALVRALNGLLPQLGDRLMRNVVEMARSCGCHRAVLIPSGYLSVLPLHAASYTPLDGEPATAPEGRRYACDDLAITYAPSGLTLLDAHQTATRQRLAGPAQRIFITGNPHLTREDEPWIKDYRSYLPYAEWEARKIGEVAAQGHLPLTVDLTLTNDATWTRIVDGLSSADLAHLALHATFKFDDPQQSAFLVAFQKKLMLRDLLDPRQAKLDRLRLVVLSACQSAMGDVSRQSEEAVGLFGALLAGGVPGVIGTLWPVNDLATAALMESFARRYLAEGQAPDAALRGAARELRHVPEGVADPAEKGVAAEPLEGISAVVVPTELTPALRRWDELAARDPEAVDAIRALDADELEATGQKVRLFSSIPRDHPFYWAAFVFHGASLPLDGNDNTGSDERRPDHDEHVE